MPAPRAALALLLLGACHTGESTFDLEPVAHDGEALAVGAEGWMFARSRGRVHYYIVPGGPDTVPTEILSVRAEPPDVLQVEPEGGGVRVRGLRPGSAEVVVSGRVRGQVSERSLRVEVQPVAQVDWLVDGEAVQGELVLRGGSSYLVEAAPRDASGQRLWPRGLPPIEGTDGLQLRISHLPGHAQVSAAAGSAGALTFAEHTLPVRFEEVDDLALSFTAEDDLAIGRLITEGPVRLPANPQGTAEVLTPEVCTLRPGLGGEDDPRTPWHRELRVRPIERVEEGTCRLRVKVDGLDTLEAAFAWEGL